MEKTYIVKEGDTLYGISNQFGVSVTELAELNMVDASTLKVGQILRIPETYTKEEDIYLPNYTNYIVKKGHTIYSIARENNITVDTIQN